MASLGNTPVFTGVVLAGGKSSRMGLDKRFLIWGKRSLWQHMQQLLLDAGANQVFICGTLNAFNALPDDLPDIGPLGGLLTIAKNKPDGLYLFVPVDMPLLNPAMLLKLVGDFASYSDEIRAAVFGKYNLPLALRLDSFSRDVIHKIADNAHNRSIKQLLTELNGISIELEKKLEYTLVNCNTPSQWLAAKQTGVQYENQYKCK